MATKKLTHAQARKLVETLAKDIAQEHGARLSPPALKQLTAPSEQFFAEHGPVDISVARLRRELTPLVTEAAKTAPTRRVLRKKGGGGHRMAARKSAVPSAGKKTVRGGDIKKAMAGATCHFLWFC